MLVHNALSCSAIKLVCCVLHVHRLRTPEWIISYVTITPLHIPHSQPILRQFFIYFICIVYTIFLSSTKSPERQQDGVVEVRHTRRRRNQHTEGACAHRYRDIEISRYRD